MSATLMGARTAPDERFAVLTALSHALAREEHLLRERPETLWQQMYNHLQWEPRIARELEPTLLRRARPGSTPWMREKTPSSESRALLRTLVGHGKYQISNSGAVPYAVYDSGVSDCAVTPDSRFIVSAGGDHAVKVWDLAQGRELRTLLGHDAIVTACAASPDGRYVVSASWDHSLKFWDPESGKELRSLTGGGRGIVACAVSPDGRFVLSTGTAIGSTAPGGGDPMPRLWDAQSGREVMKFAIGKEYAADCAFSPDGRAIALVGPWQSLKLWDARTGELAMQFTDPHFFSDGNVCTFSPDGRHLLSASKSGALGIWDPATGSFLRALVGHSNEISACAFSPDGRYIASGSSDKTVRLWDVETGTQIGALVSDGVAACTFSPDGRVLVSASRVDNTLKMWDVAVALESTDEPNRQPGHQDAVHSCAFSPDGRLLASASRDKSVRLLCAENGVQLQVLTGHTGEVKSCAFSPDGQRLASSDDKGGARLWDVGSGKELRTLTGRLERDEQFARGSTRRVVDAVQIMFSPDGSHILATRGDHLQFWDGTDGSELQIVKWEYEDLRARGPDHCLFGPDGRFLAVSTEHHLFTEPGGQEVRVFPPPWPLGAPGRPEGIYSSVFSPDGRTVASVGWELHLWDVETGRSRYLVEGWDARECAISPDGQFLVTLHGDSELIVSDLVRGGIVGRIILPTRVYSGIVIHPSTPRMAYGDITGTIHLLDLVGLEYGPLIVTVIERGGQLTVRCPSCFVENKVMRSQIGDRIICPHAKCRQALRLNPFTLKPLTTGTTRGDSHDE